MPELDNVTIAKTFQRHNIDSETVYFFEKNCDGNKEVILRQGYYVNFDEIMKNVGQLKGQFWENVTQEYLPSTSTFSIYSKF